MRLETCLRIHVFDGVTQFDGLMKGYLNEREKSGGSKSLKGDELSMSNKLIIEN